MESILRSKMVSQVPPSIGTSHPSYVMSYRGTCEEQWDFHVAPDDSLLSWRSAAIMINERVWDAVKLKNVIVMRYVGGSFGLENSRC